MTWKGQNDFCVPMHGTESTVKAARSKVVLPRGVRDIPADACLNQSCADQILVYPYPPHVHEYFGV